MIKHQRQRPESIKLPSSERNVKKATFLKKTKERREGHMKDALALGGEEGRDKLR